MSLAPYSNPQLLETWPADPQDGQFLDATLLVWVDRVRPDGTLHGSAKRAQPSLVLSHPHAGLKEGRIDLTSLGYAHRVTAVAFTPGPGCSSVTLREALETSPDSRVAEYLVTDSRFVDLYTVGWAARAAEVVFNY